MNGRLDPRMVPRSSSFVFALPRLRMESRPRRKRTYSPFFGHTNIFRWREVPNGSGTDYQSGKI
jgi:hypothetical protein